MMIIIADGKLARDLTKRIPACVPARVLPAKRALRIREGSVSLAIITRQNPHKISAHLSRLKIPVIFVGGGIGKVLHELLERHKWDVQGGETAA